MDTGQRLRDTPLRRRSPQRTHPDPPPRIAVRPPADRPGQADRRPHDQIATASRSITLARVHAAVRRLLCHRKPARRSPVLLALGAYGGRDELRIGRHAGCDVVLHSGAVSRRHALLRFRGGNWVLQDLNSTNRTTLNDRPVSRCQLRPGDRLPIGEHRVEGGHSPAHAAAPTRTRARGSPLSRPVLGDPIVRRGADAARSGRSLRRLM